MGHYKAGWRGDKYIALSKMLPFALSDEIFSITLVNYVGNG